MGEPGSSDVAVITNLPSPEPQLTSSTTQLLESVGRLDDLASAIQSFRSGFDELTNHLNFIDKSIQARINFPNPNPNPNHSPKPKSNSIPAPAPAAGKPASPPPRNPSDASLRLLCEAGDWKNLRRYIIDGLNDERKLRKELPVALRASGSPARLVLDCVGRFFVQGIRAFEKDPRLVRTRRASVLALESLVTTFGAGLEVEEKVRREAEEAAVLWRRRMVNERSLGKEHEMDARGLLFLIAVYGVPKTFRDNDIFDLFRVSKGKPEVLRKSRLLLTKVTEILEKLMRNGMRIEALDLVIAFGIEDKFPPAKILASFLESCTGKLKEEKREAKDSLTLLQRAYEKSLAKLKSALKFIEDRQLDSLRRPLKETIAKLEEEYSKVAHRPSGLGKRRASDDEDRQMSVQETKHSRLASTNGFHEHTADNYAVERSPHNGLLRTNVFDPGAARLIAEYPVSESLKYGSHLINGRPTEEPMICGARAGSSGDTLLREQTATDHLDFRTPYRDLSYNRSAVENTLHVSGAGYFPGSTVANMSGAGSQMLSSRAGPSSVYDVPSTGSFRLQREMEASRGEQTMIGNGELNGWSGSRDATLISRSPGRSIVGQHALGLIGTSTSIESFVGFPHSPLHGSAPWTTADLYRFVDAVVEMEYGSSSNNGRRSPSVMATRHSSYMHL